VTAAFGVPLVSKWNDLKDLEARYTELNGSQITLSERNGGGRNSQRSGRAVISDLKALFEQGEIPEIAERLLRNEYYNEPLESELLIRQVEGLGVEELKQLTQLTQRVNIPQNRDTANSIQLIGKVLAERVGYEECFELFGFIKSGRAGNGRVVPGMV
jgi:hypothetical protein